MKKLLFLLSMFAAMAFTIVPVTDCKAQLRTMTVTAADDTLVNGDTGYVSIQVNEFRSIITFELNVLKNSGTVAGTAILQGSFDGTNYVQIGSTAYTITDVAAQYANWIVTPSSHIYYRIRVITTGTQSSSPSGKALIRTQ